MNWFMASLLPRAGLRPACSRFMKAPNSGALLRQIMADLCGMSFSVQDLSSLTSPLPASSRQRMSGARQCTFSMMLESHRKLMVSLRSVISNFSIRIYMLFSLAPPECVDSLEGVSYDYQPVGLYDFLNHPVIEQAQILCLVYEGDGVALESRLL